MATTLTFDSPLASGAGAEAQHAGRVDAGSRREQLGFVDEVAKWTFWPSSPEPIVVAQRMLVGGVLVDGHVTAAGERRCVVDRQDLDRDGRGCVARRAAA